MAPRARLTFTPTASSSPPTDKPAPPAPLTASHKPLPPLPPQVDVKGVFSLLPTGGVRVGETSVSVERGMRVERGVGGAAAKRDERTLRSLWWIGRDGKGKEGTWQLFLLNATEADLLAVHRILLFLPPSAPDPLPLPSFSSTPGQPSYRNSLILFDETYRSVIGVIPLSSPLSSAPPADTTPPPHVHPPEPSPSYHPSAADFAHYIDHVANSLHPSPTPEQLRQEREKEAEERERKAKEEEKSNELPIPLPFLDYAVRPADDGTGDEGDEVDEGEQPGREAHGHRRLEQGMERLDLEMELACEHNPSKPPTSSSSASAVPSHLQRQRHPSQPASTWTVSSFATFGTERFVTADEGDEDAELASRRSSFAPTVREDSSPVSGAGEDATPRPTKLLPSPTTSTTTLPSAGIQSPSPPFIPASPSHNSTSTLTNGNAVLLSFLNTPTVLLPSPSPSPSSASSALNKVSVSAHPLSAEQASWMTLRGEIKAAELETPADKEKGGEEGGSWWAWLSGLWRPIAPLSPSLPTTETTTSGEAGGVWLDWLLRSLFSPTPLSANSTSSVPTHRSRLPRRASGETTSRLSVYHVDEEGRGRRAFVPV